MPQPESTEEISKGNEQEEENEEGEGYLDLR